MGIGLNLDQLTTEKDKTGRSDDITGDSEEKNLNIKGLRKNLGNRSSYCGSAGEEADQYP